MRITVAASILLTLIAAWTPLQRADTGVLQGLVITDTPAPRPVRRATVRLSGAGPTTRLVGTDDEGRFLFDGLPAGSFTLSVTKPGYVQTFYGSKHPGRGPGMLIALADGGREDVTVKILPGAAITGVLTDVAGRPAPSVPVIAVALRATPATPPASATTDDRGVYRIYGLAPGDYLVSAVPRVVFWRGYPISDIAATTDDEVAWARRVLETGAPGAPPPPPMPRTGPTVAYAPVYYPGTPDPAAAVRVVVGTAEERSGIDLSIRAVPMSRVAGTLVDASGQPVTNASVALYPRRREQPSAADLLVSSGALTLPRATMSGAAFSIASVAPGDYTLVARTGTPQRGAPPSAGGSLWSVTDLTVDGFDQTNLLLRLLPGVNLSGAIVFKRATLPPPVNVTTIDMTLSPAGVASGTAPAPRAFIEPGGTFRFSSIPPGFYVLKVTPPAAAASATWTLESAILKGRDLSEGRFEVRSGADLDGLVVTFTDHPSRISGRLVDAAGGPVTRYSIVVFPSDRALWLPDTRRIRITPPSTDGSFGVAGLPPGEYAIAAAEDVDIADLRDPSFLARLLATAYTFTLRDGEVKQQDLRIGR